MDSLLRRSAHRRADCGDRHPGRGGADRPRFAERGLDRRGRRSRTSSAAFLARGDSLGPPAADDRSRPQPGVNPDLIRCEEEAHRDGATLTDAGIRSPRRADAEAACSRSRRLRVGQRGTGSPGSSHGDRRRPLDDRGVRPRRRTPGAVRDSPRWVLLSGTVEYEFSDGRPPLVARVGNGFTLPPGTAHRGRNRFADPARLLVVAEPYLAG